MKVHLFAVLLLLITNSVVAQKGFSIKLSQDTSGLFTVTAKSNVAITQPVLGSAQVTLVAPTGGLNPSNLVNHTAEWETELVNTSGFPLEGDYVSFYLQPGKSFFLDAIVVGEELELFTFRNTAECLGPIQFIDPSYTLTPSIPLNLGMDFGVIDLTTDEVFSFIDTYGDETACSVDQTPNYVPAEVEQTGPGSAILIWQPIGEVINYQLEARLKATTEWETAEMIMLAQPKAYFYGIPNQQYEVRLITEYADGNIDTSPIFEFSLN